MKILITGGSGFVGLHTAQFLQSHGIEVRIMDIVPPKLECDYFKGDITKPTDCFLATYKVDAIIHLAALTDVNESMTNANKYHTTNIEGTYNILEAARQNGVKRIVFASSAAVYGNSAVPCTELMELHPLSPYGISKVCGENYCKMFSYLYGINTAILRYFNIFGEGANGGVIKNFIGAKLNNAPLTIAGTGKQIRDFIYVKDVAYANYAVLSLADVTAPIINIASGMPRTILDAANDIDKLMSPSSQMNFLPAREGDILISIADTTIIKNYIYPWSITPFPLAVIKTIEGMKNEKT